MIRFTIAAAFLLSAGGQAFSKTITTEKANISVEVVATGLEHPWGMAFLPDGAVLVTERPGRMVISQNGNVGRPLANVPDVVAVAQGGLLDVALDPEFENNNLIYFTYSASGPGGAGTAVARAELVRDGLSGELKSVTDIFRMNRFTGNGRHFGSRLVFAPDGTLFFSIGDRGARQRAQDPGDHAGTIIRINPDGSIPDDNPKIEGWAPEIWSTGHRNPQGLALRPSNGAIYDNEHGPRGGDEVNRPEAGKNYGWPEISYGVH